MIFVKIEFGSVFFLVSCIVFMSSNLGKRLQNFFLNYFILIFPHPGNLGRPPHIVCSTKTVRPLMVPSRGNNSISRFEKGECDE